MKEKIEAIIQNFLKSYFNLVNKVSLSIPPKKDFGDFATNIAFVISKELGQNPKDVAKQITNEIEKNGFRAEIAGPGFINIFVDRPKFLISILKEILIEDRHYLVLEKGNHKKVSIEHTATNPNKHLHVGHLRNFSIGDTLAKVFKNCGYDVTIQFSLQDQGLQVAKVVWGFLNLDKLNLSEFRKYINDENQGDKFDWIASKVYVTAEKVIASDSGLEDEIREIIQKMEAGNNEIADFGENITRRILKGHLETVQKFDVFYDQIITESTMTQTGEVERIINKLKETGKVMKENEGKNKGCVVIKGTKDSNGNALGDKVLLRKDGTAVYAGKDIILHLWKFGLMDIEFHFKEFITQSNNEKIWISISNNDGKLIQGDAEFHINVVDQRQTYPLEIVKQSLRTLGYERESTNFHHLAYETVVLTAQTAKKLGFEQYVEQGQKQITMSGRKGIEVPIDEILDKVKKVVLEVSENKGTNLSESEAEKIAASSLRYYMIKFGYNTIIAFDIDEVLRSDGDTGVYLMYSYVRAKSIIERVGKLDSDFEIAVEIDEVVFDLVNKISFARSILSKVSDNLEINQLAEYTHELAKTFTSFYQKINIVREADLIKKNIYLNVVKSYQIVFGELLKILGVHTPEKI